MLRPKFKKNIFYSGYLNMNGGNGDYVEYTYGKLDRVSYKKYNGTNLGFWGYYANG